MAEISQDEGSAPDPDQAANDNGDENYPTIWDSPREPGSPFASVGATPVAVLGGFSLSTMVQIAGSRNLDAWKEVSSILFAIAVISFIFALLFLFKVSTYNASPAERIARAPEVKHDPRAFERERGMQWQDERLLDIYSKYAGIATSAGMSFALVAAGAALISATSAIVGLVCAFLLVGCATFVVLFYFDVPKRLFPTKTVGAEPPKLPNDRFEWLK